MIFTSVGKDEPYASRQCLHSDANQRTICYPRFEILDIGRVLQQLGQQSSALSQFSNRRGKSRHILHQIMLQVNGHAWMREQVRIPIAWRWLAREIELTIARVEPDFMPVNLAGFSASS